MAYSVITTAAEGSFWPTLLSRRRRRGRFGLLYYSYGGRDVILACSIVSMAVAESVWRKSFGILIYYREKVGNLTMLEPSPREVVYQVVDDKVKLYIYKEIRRTRRERPARCSVRDENFCSSWW